MATGYETGQMQHRAARWCPLSTHLEVVHQRKGSDINTLVKSFAVVREANDPVLQRQIALDACSKTIHLLRTILAASADCRFDRKVERIAIQAKKDRSGSQSCTLGAYIAGGDREKQTSEQICRTVAGSVSGCADGRWSSCCVSVSRAVHERPTASSVRPSWRSAVLRLDQA